MHKIPTHLAIIMDGNGRYAKAKGLPRSFGHKKGSDNVKAIALYANQLGIQYLTLYAFSSENWKRPEDEKNYLFKLPKIFFELYLQDFIKNNIRIETIGDLTPFPTEMKNIIHSAIEKTKQNTGMTLCFALNYGGQQEIVSAMQKYANQCVQNNIVLPLDINNMTQYLLQPTYPVVDLMIRTSGEQRISNFLLWQLAYAEMVFVDVHWPEFTKEELDTCLATYTKRDRRFGGLNDEK